MTEPRDIEKDKAMCEAARLDMHMSGIALHYITQYKAQQEEVRQLREEQADKDAIAIQQMQKLNEALYASKKNIFMVIEERDKLLELLKVAKAHIQSGNPGFALIDINQILSGIQGDERNE